jgi:hypothetical protein
MAATQKPQQSESSDAQERVQGEFPPVPDEDGPHDVPDETVIEKTLPAGKPGGDGGRSA